MKHITINETINPNQSDMTGLFDANSGEWGDVSKSFSPEINAVIHSNIVFVSGILPAETTEIKLNDYFAFYAEKTILEIYELDNGIFIKSNSIASVEGKIITVPIVNNSFLIKGFLIGRFETSAGGN